MKKSLLIPIIALILLSSLATAALQNSDAVVYHTLETDYTDDTGNGFTGAAFGSPTLTTGFIGNGRDLSGTAEGILLANLTEEYYAIRLAIKPDVTVGTGTYQMILSDDVGGNYLGLGGLTGSCTNEVISMLVNSSYRVCWNNAVIGHLTAGTWHDLLINWNTTSGHYDLWINGTNRGGPSQTSGGPGRWTGESFVGNGLYIGNYMSGNDFDGTVDEYVVINKSLTKLEAIELNGTTFPFGTTVGNFSLTAQDSYFNTSILVFNATINGTLYNTTNGSIFTTIPSNSSSLFNITFTAENYFDKTYLNYNVSTNLNGILTRNFTVLNVTAYDYTDTKITNFSATVSVLGGILTSTKNTTSGELEFNLPWNQTYNVTIDAPGYATSGANASIYMNESFKRVNITEVYTTNSVNFSFFDEDTSLQVYNVSFELISDVFSNNYSTNPNSSTFLELLSPADYTVRYSADGFPERFYYFTLTNRSFTNLNLYLVNATDVTVTVIDEKGSIVQNARVEVQKFDVDTNAYILSQIAQTNLEGEAIINVELASEFYKFSVRVSDELKPILPSGSFVTDPTYIYDTTLNIQIRLTDSIGDDFYRREDVTYDLMYNDLTENFRLTYSDAQGTATLACVELFTITGISVEQIDTTCATGAAGTILQNATRINGTTYRADAYVYFGTQKVFLTTELKNFPVTNNTGNLGLFLVLIITIVMASTGLWNPIIAVGITPIPMTLASIIGLVDIGPQFTIPVQVFAIVLAFIMGNKA